MVAGNDDESKEKEEQPVKTEEEKAPESEKSEGTTEEKVNCFKTEFWPSYLEFFFFFIKKN